MANKKTGCGRDVLDRSDFIQNLTVNNLLIRKIFFNFAVEIHSANWVKRIKDKITDAKSRDEAVWITIK